ncbi:MAG: trigger factor [Gloeomargarita sp. SKYBB_i_bin120]|nr:trigger factor [Gloeomargarita sp. SKYG98]MCS7293519.1 trigger factor [Gloeomargarita sp. SKYB120]MDW8179085.1 trigger factor [Gloeomargarita sp. SKYBB_i_bin120]
MKITQEPLPNSQIGLRVEVPAEEVAKRHETVFRRMLRDVRLPGFRRGKVPPHILRQYLGEASIHASVVEELIQTAMPQALQNLEVPTLGEPELRDPLETLVQNYRPDRPFVFQIAVDVWPEVTLGDYQRLKIQAEKYEFDPQVVDRILEHHRRQRATLVPVERPAQVGDVAIVDMQAYRATDQGRGEAVGDLTAQDVEVPLEPEDNRFFPEVVNGLVGMQVGETKELTVTTPADFWEPALAGQTLIVDVTLKELKEPELPELDDLFAQAISDCQTLEELRNFLAEREQKRAEQKTQQSIEAQLREALVAITTTELPQTLVERHLNDLLQDVAQALMQGGMTPEQVRAALTSDQVEKLANQLRPLAEKKTKQFLALKAVAERENLNPTPEALQARIQELRQRSEAVQGLDETQLRRVVESALRMEMALQWLQEHAEITFVPPGTLDQPELPLEATESSPPKQA